MEHGMERSMEQEDAFGLLLTHYLEGKPCHEIIERDDGFIDVTGGPATYFSPFDAWPARQQQAMNFVRGRVLDVGVGAGRFALHLQEQGHEVVGIDVSPGALDVCRRRGVQDVRLLPFHRVDASLGRFDTILMMGNNFGLFANPRRARWLLRSLKKLTADDACIIGETNDPYTTDKPEHLAYHERNRRRGRMAGELRLRVRYRERIGPWFDYLMVSQAELGDLVQGTGWAVGQLLTDEGSQYVAVLQKE